jgi:hypothetical protein
MQLKQSRTSAGQHASSIQQKKRFALFWTDCAVKKPSLNFAVVKVSPNVQRTSMDGEKGGLTKSLFHDHLCLSGLSMLRERIIPHPGQSNDRCPFLSLIIRVASFIPAIIFSPVHLGGYQCASAIYLRVVKWA